MGDRGGSIREILFRGKRKEDGVWVSGYYSVSVLAGKVCALIRQDGIDYEVCPETVGQYTGLDDCNGIKIFEGDIVVIKRNVRAIVGYHYGRFMLTTLERKVHIHSLYGYYLHIKVIGNIYTIETIIKEKV